MAKSFLTPIDMNKLEILNVRTQNLASAPASPVTGQPYYDTATSRWLYWNGTAWVNRATIADDASLLAGQTSAFHLARANHTGTQTSTTISDFTEASQDVAGAFFVAGVHTGITATYGATQDTANRIDLAVTDSPLLGGQSSAYHLSRTNHSGTQTASTISDFNTAVRTNTLNQMATATADVTLGGFKLTNVATPTLGTDAANKSYVDAAVNGLDWKASVRAASTANVALTGTQTIDAVVLIATDRVLLKNQTAGAENGIWVVAAGAWARSTDADISAEVTSGLAVFVEEGTTNGNQQWALSTDNPITLGTTALVFAQIGAQGGAPAAGNGLTLVSNTYDVVPAASGGITVAADSISVDTAIVVRKYATTVGDGTALFYVITHSLSTLDVTTEVYRNSGVGDKIECDVEHTSTTTITLRFAVAPTSAQYRVVVHG